MTRHLTHLSAILLLVAGTLIPTRLAAQDRIPYTADQLVRLLDSGVFSDQRILTLARESCLGFQMDAASEKKLRDAGASDPLISELGEVCVRLPRKVDTVQVTPARLTLSVGGSRVVRARVLAPDSTELEGVVVEWASEDTTIADVSMGGLVLARAPGQTRIIARVREDGQVTAGSALLTVPAREGAAAGDARTEPERPGGKSTTTAAVLGAVVPGGGEFYTGRTGRGALVLLGSAAALGVGYAITSEEVLDVQRELTAVPDCSGTSCDFQVRNEARIEESHQVIIGAAVAGAFWAFGLIDGILRANSWEPLPPEQEEMGGEVSRGPTIELAPADGVQVGAAGDLELTFIRVRP